jgi:DNA-binding transcriptional regulator YhcF (GntR family)
MRENSAHAVRDLVIDRLIAGSYQQGGKLPAASELANELGVHRNTVAKAYQLLSELGLVKSTRGRGTFVSALTGPENQQNLLASVTEALEHSIRQARRIGVTREELESIIAVCIDAMYEANLARGLFVECNMPDIRAHIDEIAAATKVRLDPLLLDEVPTRLRQVNSDELVVVTSLFHYREVNEVLAEIRPDVLVIGVHTIPSESSLEKLASIPSGSNVGVVANNPAGSRRVASLVETYSSNCLHVCSSPTIEDIRALARDVDILVCTRDQEQTIRLVDLDVPVLSIPFHVSPNSAARVLEVMLENRPKSQQVAAQEQ